MTQVITNTTCIYRHIRLDTNKVFYIGIGNIKRPYSKLNRNQYWKNITNKHDYEIQILKSDLSWSDACELEKILISYYGRNDLNLGTLVNLTDGGDGITGVKHSDKTKLKISLGNKNKIVSIDTRMKLRNINIGRKHSEISKQKVSQANKGRKHSEELKLSVSLFHKGRKRSEETKLKMRENNKWSRKVIDLLTNKIYLSITVAAKENNIKRETLRGYLTGRYKNKTTLKFL